MTALLYAGVALGLAAIALGFGIYRRMDSVRRREQAVTGALLGILAVQCAVVLLVFRSGRPDLFAKHFLNFAVLEPYFIASFLNAVQNTVVLALVGEIGGIVIGLVLAMLALSGRRAARAPARIYVNFFRGTPLIWQLATFYFLLLFGFEVQAVGVQRGDDRVRAEHGCLRRGGLPRRHPVDRTGADGGRSILGDDLRAGDAVRDRSAGGPSGDPAP